MFIAKNILLFLAVLLVLFTEVFFLRQYLKTFYPTRTMISLRNKMICATCYIALALLGVLYRGEISPYSRMVLLAFVLSWVGDFLLHVPKGNAFFNYGVGAAAFFVGHFFFIGAFSSLQSQMLHLYVNVYYWQLIVPVVAAVLFLVAFRILGIKTGKLTVPCFLYALLVCAMAVSAFALAVTLLQKQDNPSVAAVVMLSLGGLCFLQSDISLGMSFFSDKYKKLGVQVFTMVTYFTAQTLLASTIFLLG
ncbi:MAG TPA: hypothetical protein DDY98_00345 [Ruminococcaceae bacterium]|nr:hypothetical protein [Oscillospiraceae bacterium]